MLRLMSKPTRIDIITLRNQLILKTENTICFFASKNEALSYQILIRHAINSMPRKEGLTFLLHFPYVVELTFYR